MESTTRPLVLPLELAQHIASFCSIQDLIFVLPQVSRTFSHACRVPLVQRTVLRTQMLRFHLKPDQQTFELHEEEHRQAEERVEGIVAILETFAPCHEPQEWSEYWYRWLVSLHHLMRDEGTESFIAFRDEMKKNFGQVVSPNLVQILHPSPRRKGAILVESLLDYLPYAIILGVRPSATSSTSQQATTRLINTLAAYFFDVPGTKGAALRHSLRGLKIGHLDISICTCLTALILQQRQNPSVVLDTQEALGGKSISQLTSQKVDAFCARNDLDKYWAARSLRVETFVAGLGIIVGVLTSHGRENKPVCLPEFNSISFPYFALRPSRNKFRQASITATSTNEPSQLSTNEPSSQFKGDYSSKRILGRSGVTSGLSRGYSFVHPGAESGSDTHQISSQCFKAYTFMPDKISRENYGEQRGRHNKLPPLEDEDGKTHQVDCRVAEQGTPWCYQVTAHDTGDGHFIGAADKELWVGQMSPFGVSGIVHVPAPNRRLSEHLEEGRGVFWLW